MDLTNQVVLVTGASRGIGLEIAKLLVQRGARVGFAARSEECLVAETRALGNLAERALPLVMDVTAKSSVSAAVERMLARFGRIDLLVNNAGGVAGVRPWLDDSSVLVERLFDVNVFGTERVMRATLPAMLAQGKGTIVNFASTLAWVSMPGAAAYSAAKAAVVSLSTALREELRGQGIDVRVFAPPHTSTETGRTMPLDLPKIFEPSWVASEFVRSLAGSRATVLPGGNGALLALQRLSPALAARIMNGIGFRALERAKALNAPGA